MIKTKRAGIEGFTFPFIPALFCFGCFCARVLTEVIEKFSMLQGRSQNAPAMTSESILGFLNGCADKFLFHDVLFLCLKEKERKRSKQGLHP
ncbi:MAG: hypothetical protein IKD07_03630 [Clostridia bacterium]|nr:hypothetical protein [Clostridia bacterium]